MYLQKSQLKKHHAVLPDRTNGCSIQNIDLTHQVIIKQLKTHKSCGPDNCQPHVLKEIKNRLIVPIFTIFFGRVYLTIKLEAGYSNRHTQNR